MSRWLSQCDSLKTCYPLLIFMSYVFMTSFKFWSECSIIWRNLRKCPSDITTCIVMNKRTSIQHVQRLRNHTPHVYSSIHVCQSVDNIWSWISHHWENKEKNPCTYKPYVLKSLPCNYHNKQRLTIINHDVFLRILLPG